MPQPTPSPIRSGTRTHFTHAYLFRGASDALERSQAEEPGSFYQAMLAVLATAFAAEAYLNYMGPLVAPNWTDDDERLEPNKKLKRVARAAGYELDTNSGEYRDFNRLFRARNLLVHGRKETVHAAWDPAVEGISGADSLATQWMMECNPVRAAKLLNSARALIVAIHRASGRFLDPFMTMAEGESSGGI